ncbi:MAG: S8 family serine peptidase [Melioribacteraceae bacterium]|nr:S8 family serine peptidase [Melioribacteraceae bacterium]
MKWILSIILVLLTTSNLYSQINQLNELLRNKKGNPLLNQETSNSTAGQIYDRYFKTNTNTPSIITTIEGEEPVIQNIDLDEKMEIIIEFKEVPYLIRKKMDGYADESIYFNRFSQIRNVLEDMQQSQLNKLNDLQPNEIKINKEFYKLFFGVSATVRRGNLNRLNELKYVKKLHYNREMKANLSESISLIKVDSVWSQFGVKGDSIVIAIIDTGIDYLHPALGGGFGPGFKVIGGYDFINNDDDPIDDNGHGTHVAGIVSADGDSIIGIAPKSSLIALKVLDRSGRGRGDDIIAAIEYCADPNGDGNTDDMVDIINLSLGSYYGNPDDPTSVAVDNASFLGITSSIAAGNGYSYKSIGSPGTAKSAITVGASDSEDKLAIFSSKGPVNKTYSIKPDVVAPGVDINSLKLGGGTVEYSGTSMAAPIVAGVCALLKSIHPNWGPEELKSALMTTSIDIGEEAMAQGAGRIDALKAAKVQTTIFPSQLSFGIDNLEETNWVVADTLTISNHSDIMQTYSFQKDVDHSGINIEFYPTSISIDAGAEGEIIVELSVDNSIVPFPDWASLSYDGNILISGNENLHIPFAFVKAAKLIIVSDSPRPFGGIIGSNYVSPIYFSNDMYEAEIILPPNTYDIFASIHGDEKIKILTKEEIEITDYKRVDLDFNNLEIKVIYDGVDELGNPLEYPSKQFILFPPLTTPLIGASYSFPYDTLYFSDISDRYKLSFSESSVDEVAAEKITIVHHTVLEGISDNLLLQNDPSTFIRREIEVRSRVDNAELSIFNDGVIGRNLFRTGGFQIYVREMDSSSWRGEILLSSFKNDTYLPSVSFFAGTFSIQGFEGYSTPLILEWNGKLQPFSSFKPSADVLLTNQDSPIVFGRNPLFSDALFLNNYWEDYNFITSFAFYGSNQEFFYNMENNSILKVFDKNNNLVQSDSNTILKKEMLPEEYYRVEFTTSNYSLNGIEGELKLVSDFDLSAEDSTPPKITSLKFLNQTREIKDHFSIGDSILIYFSSADIEYNLLDYSYSRIYNSINSSRTELSVRINGLEKWKPVEVFTISEDSTIGFLYKADLTSYANLDSASIDLQLQFIDMAGNKTNWKIAPAFTVGKMPVITDVEDSEIEGSTEQYSFKLEANYPNPFNPSTTIKYQIPSVQTPLLGGVGGGLVTLKVYDILGREVATLVNKQQKAGNYEVSFDASNLTSGVYFYRLQATNSTGQGFNESKKMLLLK